MERQLVIDALKASKSALEETGLERLYLFGSLARGDNTATSDIDLAATFVEEVESSPLKRLDSISLVADILGTYNFDLADVATLRDHIRPNFERERISIF